MRRTTVHIMALLLGICWIGVLLGCAATPASEPAVRDGLFVHIKSGPQEPHSVLMALRMAQMMADEHDVLVYLDVEGIGVVLTDGPDLQMKPFGSSHSILRDLMARGVGVYACPGCLTAKGLNTADLMPGVQAAQKQAFFDFTQGRILTLDY